MNKPYRCFMGIPSTGTRSDVQCYILREIAERMQGIVEFVYPTQCAHRIFHDFARNAIVEEFLESDCDVLWFLDSDVCPPKHILDNLIQKWDEWQVAGAPYPIWMTPPGGDQPCVVFTAYNGVKDSPGNRGIVMTEVPHQGTAWIDGLATGCLFLKRDVFSKIQRPFFEFKYDPTSRNLTEGEDLGFALKLHKLGIKFFVDYGAVCKHYKTVDLLEINNYATDWSNGKILEYDKDIRAQVEQATQAAYVQGKIDAARELRDLTKGQKTTKSGLILPQSLAT